MGKCFVSYRRSRLDEVSRIVEAMLDHGVPPWQDLRELSSQPLGPALRAAIGDRDTAGSLMWVSRDIAESATILELEAPLIFSRSRTDPTFVVELWLADNVQYDEANELLRPAGLVESVSTAWHLECARTVPVHQPDGSVLHRINDAEARRIASHLLRRRLREVHRVLPAEEPLRLLLRAHGDTGDAYVPGYPLQINWARHFAHRHAESETWSSRLVPALSQVLAAVRASAPGRGIVAEGPASIASCLALGSTFREVTGVSLSWKQHPAGVIWSLQEPERDSGCVVDPVRDIQIGAVDLAVFVSVTGNVEAAVAATSGLPRFRGIVSIRPENEAQRCELQHPGQATHVARQIARAIREGRAAMPGIKCIHLFFAGPAGLAVLLGQQLNALGPIQTYEQVQPEGGVSQYRRAALLSDPAPPA